MSIPKFLIIDDDSVDREIIKRYLASAYSDKKYLVEEADTGASAIQKLERESYQCVFLDYLLPDMDGLEVLRRFYDQTSDLSRNPVVMLTGQGKISVMLDALRLGAQDYLAKDNISRESFVIALTKAQEVYELKRNQREAQIRLYQSEKMEALGQLTSGVAHDFNNLLTVVLGNARLLKKRIQDGDGDLSLDDIVKKIQVMETAAKRGADLVRRLMVFTRQGPTTEEILNINAFIKDTLDLLKQTLGDKVKIETHFINDPWPLFVDINQFTSVLINMAVNAKHAMVDGGILSIETDKIIWDDLYSLPRGEIPQGGYAVITLTDTGSGIPESVKEKIFEPFFTTKPVGQGTGLGLSMAFGFIKQAGGHIQLYSEENTGTVFRIYLPKTEAYRDNYDELANSDEDMALSQGDETVLIVGPDNTQNRIDKDMFEKLGYDVLVTSNLQSAMDKLSEGFKINLVAIDTNPVNEWRFKDLSDEIERRYPEASMIYLTGFSYKSLPEYLRAYSHRILCRPYKLSVAAKAIRSAIDVEDMPKEYSIAL